MFFLKMLNIPAPALFAVSSEIPDPSDPSDPLRYFRSP